MFILLLTFIASVNSFGFFGFTPAGMLAKKVIERNNKNYNARIAREREENDRIAREQTEQTWIEHKYDVLNVSCEYVNT